MAQEQKAPQNPRHNKPKLKQQSQLNDYLKYSGLAFQMLAVIGLAVWGGWELDQYLGLRFPVFLIVFSLGAVTASLFLTIKGLPK